jgi:FHA domain-containing protein
MVLNQTDLPVDKRRRPARDLIAEVLKNMRANLEPLRYSTLAPSRYLIYLHPNEYARLETIIPLLREQTIRALTEELKTLNKRSPVQRYAERFLGTAPPVESAAGEWQVEFLPDPDGDVEEGAILIDSQLRLPPTLELGGEKTRRITTLHVGTNVTTRARIVSDAPTAPVTRAFAKLTYDDEAGQHTFEITKDSTTIGRGGTTYPVDVKILSSPDVSREHARIRRDAQTGRFFLIDLSSLGTTLNGRHVPRGFDDADGAKKENGAETPLPDQARIGLADTVHLQFEVVVSGSLGLSRVEGSRT